MAFSLSSPAFEHGDPIPRRYTCDGEGEPPHLEWQSPPAGTRGFALVMDDPDAPGGTFTHWMLYDIPGSARELPDAMAHGRSLRNDFGRSGYGGPCPPRGHGPHRYFFTLYAVDLADLRLHGPGRRALEEALHGHTLATAKLMGHFER